MWQLPGGSGSSAAQQMRSGWHVLVLFWRAYFEGERAGSCGIGAESAFTLGAHLGAHFVHEIGFKIDVGSALIWALFGCCFGRSFGRCLGALFVYVYA